MADWLSDEQLQQAADAAEQARVDAAEPEPRYCAAEGCGATLDPSLPRVRWCEACAARLSAAAPDDGADRYDPGDELDRRLVDPGRSPEREALGLE
jgi:hypothetical protein